MKRWERWTFNALSVAVVVTGFAYLWMKYALESSDPFAVVNHPWQTSILGLHVVASPAFILIFGMILNSHIMKKLSATRLPNRRSGLVSLGTFTAMVVSGYLLQVRPTVGMESQVDLLVLDAVFVQFGLFGAGVGAVRVSEQGRDI